MILRVERERWSWCCHQSNPDVYWFNDDVIAVPDALASMVRTHWKINNNAYCLGNGVFQEEQSLKYHPNTNPAVTLLTTIVLNLYRRRNSPSITHAIERFTNYTKGLFEYQRT